MSDTYVPPPSRALAYDCVHVAATDHIATLIDELEYRGSTIVETRDELVFSQGVPGPAAWAQNSWLDPREYEIGSIGEGARILSSLQRNWHLHSIACHRRARLIDDKLATIRFKPLVFPAALPRAPLGAYTLLDRHRLLASPRCTSAFADGRPIFVEDRDGPPNRAYLKLWEALTLAGVQPGPSEKCLDLGASPGGWTWVLADLRAEVVAVDRAELTPALAAHPRVQARRGDAFALTRDDIDVPDWIFSDVIAYPERLFALAEYWCHACPNANVILTVKYQGSVNPADIQRFLSLDGAGLHHLAANKHELTFFRLPEIDVSDTVRTRL